MKIRRIVWPVVGAALCSLGALTCSGSAPATEVDRPVAQTTPDMTLDELRVRLAPLTRAQLADESAAWLGFAQLRARATADKLVAIAKSSGEQQAQLRAGLAPLIDARRRVFDQFEIVLQAWEIKGGDATAIADYRRYMSAVRSEDFRVPDRSAIWVEFKRWITARDGGIHVGILLLGFAGAFLALLVLAKVIASLVARGLARFRNLSTLLQVFLVRATFWSFFTIGLLTVLSLFGLRLTPVLTLLGGLSVVAAFATQSVLSNFAAGLMIMIYKPFDVGHVVTVGGVTGTVKAMNLVSTALVTADNQLIVVPNSNVWGSIITNINANATRRVDLLFGISYEDDENAAVTTLEDLIRTHPLVLKEPAPVVRVHQLADSSVNIVCRPWARTEDYWPVYWDLTRQVKARFDAAGITIPLPQRDVHIHARKEEQGTSRPVVVSQTE
jgi:small conductance mechanosensitive channel